MQGESGSGVRVGVGVGLAPALEYAAVTKPPCMRACRWPYVCLVPCSYLLNPCAHRRCSLCVWRHLTSPHLTSPHLTSPHLTSIHLTSRRFTSLHSLCSLCSRSQPRVCT